MKVEHLLIDIGTILKMVRFIPSFKEYFVKNKYLTPSDQSEITKYALTANILSKQYLWDFCSILEHVIEINILIKQWREVTNDYANIENNIHNTPEKPYTHDIIGRIIQSDKHKELLQEMKKNGFFYNKMAIIPSNINNGNLHFFY